MEATLLKNAKVVKCLHQRIQKKFKKEPHSDDHHAACKEFHDRYDQLAFPGGYENGIERIREGDDEAIDAALTFLEVRPYFYRSQYIMTKLRCLLNQASLSPDQTAWYSESKKRMKKPNRVAGSINSPGPHTTGHTGPQHGGSQTGRPLKAVRPTEHNSPRIMPHDSSQAFPVGSAR